MGCSFKRKKRYHKANKFQKILDKSKGNEANIPGHKLNKIWVDKDSNFYNISTKQWLQDNKEKSVVAKWFVTSLNNKICKMWLWCQKCVYW